MVFSATTKRSIFVRAEALLGGTMWRLETINTLCERMIGGIVLRRLTEPVVGVIFRVIVEEIVTPGWRIKSKVVKLLVGHSCALPLRNCR